MDSIGQMRSGESGKREREEFRLGRILLKRKMARKRL